MKQGSALPFKCFLPGNIIAYLNIDFLAASLRNKIYFFLIEFSDVNVIVTAKKLNADHVLVDSAVIDISAAKNCVTDTRIAQIELFGVFKVSLPADIIASDVLK